MAAPRCMRSFLGPAKRAKISHAPRPYTQAFSRTKSSRADEDNERDSRDDRDSKLIEQLRMDLENGEMPLDQRLEDLGLDPQEYKTLYASQQKVNKRQQEREPKTREEAQRQWKELQNTPDHLGLLKVYKRAGVEPIKAAKEKGITLPTDEPPLDPKTAEALEALRTPINVRAVHLRPLRRTPEHGVPTCDLQLRTYNVRSLLLFADFAVRAAYYMGLCARGPVPLPRITERWVVPRSNFIFKKSQENFERVTMRRLIQIQDGHPDVVKAWLAFLQKHQYHGVGMKANIWEYESLEDATRAGYEVKQGDYSRRREGKVMDKVEEILQSEGYKEAMKGHKSEVEMRP
ncbi:30s ribosomal protein s10 protein [Stemphylium lycopersici]|uniref:Small ribosomal subunit protein uS10m n=1 Tax=Stemphylium lycopersici TaxID=183478 RepID=A0A364NAI3_STELY|nr:30s ribosomal protein s10 protein [Stemphylium lycopersici]RAR01936.1 30s ribosomal protein s10 protein [Stemphylium lycopersici]RAR14183.1 30s ribosomal protein s10 protein [Stemphylium lycopersici]